MKTFVIETRRGFVSTPIRLGGYSFPLSFHAQISSATQFPFRAAAERSMKKYHLTDAPYHGHIEEYEVKD